ncbi:cytochrome-c oxidase, cbb3-type subunit II, partial [Staphylococcus pseudintermedius]
AYAEALTQKKVFGVPYDTENGVKLGSVEEAKKAYLEEAKKITADMKDKRVLEAIQRGEVLEIVALIAYLNSLGNSRINANQNAK